MRALRALVRSGRPLAVAGVEYPDGETEVLGATYAYNRFIAFFARRSGSVKVGRLYTSGDGIYFTPASDEISNILNVTTSIDGNAIVLSIGYNSFLSRLYRIYRSTNGTNFTAVDVPYGQITQRGGVALSLYPTTNYTFDTLTYQGWTNVRSGLLRTNLWNFGVGNWWAKAVARQTYWAYIGGSGLIFTSDNATEVPHQFLARGPGQSDQPAVSLQVVNGQFCAIVRQLISGQPKWTLRRVPILLDSYTALDWETVLLPSFLADFQLTGNPSAYVDWDLSYSTGKYLLRGTFWDYYTPINVSALSEDGLTFTPFVSSSAIPPVKNNRTTLEGSGGDAEYDRFVEQYAVPHPGGFVIYGTQKQILFVQ